MKYAKVYRAMVYNKKLQSLVGTKCLTLSFVSKTSVPDRWNPPNISNINHLKLCQCFNTALIIFNKLPWTAARRVKHNSVHATANSVMVLPNFILMMLQQEAIKDRMMLLNLHFSANYKCLRQGPFNCWNLYFYCIQHVLVKSENCISKQF